MSVAGTFGAPFHSSGAMYAGVPAAGTCLSVFTATPKSVSVHQPLASISTLSGLRSRWATRRECAAASPSSESFSTTSAAGAESGPRRVSISRSETPSTSSITTAAPSPGCSTKAKSRTMCGASRDRSCSAVARKSQRNAVSRTRLASKYLIAIRWPVVSLTAATTRPDTPWPSSRSSA